MKILKRFIITFTIALTMLGIIGCNGNLDTDTTVVSTTQTEEISTSQTEEITTNTISDITDETTMTTIEEVDNNLVVFVNTDFENIEVVTGGKIVEPNDPIKEGYIFHDWYIDEEFTTVFDFDTVISTHISLHAMFTVTLENANTIANALEHDQSTQDKYFITGTIKSISNIVYGNMVITDGVNDFTIYGVWSSDGLLKYEELEERPVVGDVVLLYGILSKYYENLEMTNSWLVDMEKSDLPIVDLTDYTEGTIAETYESDVDSKYVIEGVVARITYANGMSPNGLFLVDNTSSIYIYDSNIAASVNVGDTITVAGTRKNFILTDEISQAEALGYEGAIQIAEAILVSIIQGEADFSKDGIEEVTVKELLETDPTQENITGKIYKVNAIVNEVAGAGFTNFYINDLDDLTGTYSYSMNGGSDFTWLREYDGELVTMYVAVINGKSTASGLIYRFVPICVESAYVHNQEYNPTFAVKYFGVDQFLNEYIFSPEQELITSVSSDKLGISDISLTYSSNNTDSVFFEEADGKLILKTGIPGIATITITGVDGSNTYSEVVEILVLEDLSNVEIITIAQAIAMGDDSVVNIEGVVAASLVNKTGVYVIDETGVIAVQMTSTELDKISLGQLVVITGVKTHVGADASAVGQIAITDASILANKYGNHDYSTASFILGGSLSDLIDLDKLEDHSTKVYVITATITLYESTYYSLYTITSGSDSLNIYASSSAQLTFLEPYVGQEVTIEITVVNWNGKKYSGSVLSITYDGVKVLNDSNF